jgi:riboflavin kinase, archaea type
LKDEALVRMTGIIFSDLGEAASFMALDWVQLALRQSLGFDAFPATLNVRPKSPSDALAWRRIREESAGVLLAPGPDGFCRARLYPIEIIGAAENIAGAILFPEVNNYPNDKIEIVAPLRLKEHLGVNDGDQLTWEFRN